MKRKKKGLRRGGKRATQLSSDVSQTKERLPMPLAEVPGFLQTKDISPQLPQLVLDVRNAINIHDKQKVKSSLSRLLAFLSSAEGRTHSNCNATDLYFTLHNNYNFNWDNLDPDLQIILNDIGGQLHDTIESPRIAEEFESTPEQLLKRLKDIKE